MPPRATVTVNNRYPSPRYQQQPAPKLVLADVEAAKGAAAASGGTVMSGKLKLALWVAAVVLVASTATAVAVIVTQVAGNSSSSSSGSTDSSSSGSTSAVPPAVEQPTKPAQQSTAPTPSAAAPAVPSAVLASPAAAPSPVAASVAPAAAPQTAPAAMLPGFDVMLFSDEFDGDSLDTAKWTHDAAGTQAGGQQQQSGEGLQKYTPDSVRVANGSLLITASESDGQYTSGRINSSASGGWFPGMQMPDGRKVQRVFVQARVQVPKGGAGLWSAVWMAPVNASSNWPASGEIDILESVNDQKKIVQGLHYGGAWPENEMAIVDTEQKNGAPYSDGYHIVGADWEQDAIRMTLDGKRTKEFTSWWSPSAEWPAPFDKAFVLNLALAVGGDWPGPPNDATQFPATLAVDYVRVFAALK